MSFPRSAYDLTSGLVYFARMLHKIRLHAAGDLPSDYISNLGEGFDGRICRFLKVDYSNLREQALAQPDDAAVLEWCYQQGFRPTEDDLLMFNKYSTKFGWRDEDTGATGRLEGFKATSGFADRTDIVTFFDYYELDEGRRP